MYYRETWPMLLVNIYVNSCNVLILLGKSTEEHLDENTQMSILCFAQTNREYAVNSWVTDRDRASFQYRWCADSTETKPIGLRQPFEYLVRLEELASMPFGTQGRG